MEHKQQQSYLDKVYEAKENPVLLMETLADGFNYYSQKISEVISATPDIDHPFIYSLLRIYADALERHHPGTADMAKVTEQLVGHREICIKIPKQH